MTYGSGVRTSAAQESDTRGAGEQHRAGRHIGQGDRGAQGSRIIEIATEKRQGDDHVNIVERR